jgi:uncharacterized protein YjbI with pentapeptide repeats
MRQADFTGGSFYRADLRNADLREAILVDVDLRGADLRGAELGGVDLRGARGAEELRVQLVDFEDELPAVTS